MKIAVSILARLSVVSHFLSARRSGPRESRPEKNSMMERNAGTDSSIADSRSVADDWFTPVRFGLLLAVLIGVLFPDVLSGSRGFVFRDFGQFGYPLAHYYRESF